VSNLKQEKKITIGSWLSLGSPYVTEIMAKAGFDWLVIDMEHSAANDLAMTQRLIQVIDLAGCKPLVRVAANDSASIKLVLDAGARGILVPMINTREEAQSAVASVYYPPRGKRGVGLWRAQSYGRSFDAYLNSFTEEGLVIVQIEHIKAVENLKEILAVEGVDGFIVGPYDLSASLGIPGEFHQSAFQDALARIRDASQETDKWVGIHIVYPDAQELQARIEDGYNFIAYGVDFTFLASTVDREMKAIRQFQERRD
jgi:2-keto-3-deoxy-L-rhamnonate aldolase RhmA